MAKRKPAKVVVEEEKNLTVDTTEEEINKEPESELAEKPVEGETPLVENVSKEETKEEPAPVAGPEVKPETRVLRGVVQNCSRLNVRKGPSKETEVVAVLTAGIVTVVEETESPDWYKTKKGYVMSKFIRLLVK